LKSMKLKEIKSLILFPPPAASFDRIEIKYKI
jgi:hypothetical protein